MSTYIEEKPHIISDDTCTLFGIIREASNARQVVVMAPYSLGDRTGLTRIYVELARGFQQHGITSACFNFPPYNYSIDDSFLFDQYVEQNIVFLGKIISNMRNLYPGIDIVVLGFCSSGIPAIYAARQFGLKKVITLNPFNFPEGESKRLMHDSFADYVKYHQNPISMLHVFSERENGIWEKRKYVQKYFEDENCSVTVEYVKDTDHTFDGWSKKKEVQEILLKWLNNN